jgi:hypothetical protein
LIGGEPLLHKKLAAMIDINNKAGIKTTIYTNGHNLNVLGRIQNEGVDLTSVEIRISIYGVYKSEKPLEKIKRVNLPPKMMFVYMLRKNNVDELPKAALMVKQKFGCGRFFISSIRDIASTGDYWKESQETLPLEEYFAVVQDFIKNYNGGLEEIHISKRGIIKTEKSELITVDRCRFGNIFPSGEKITCPFDICKNIITPELRFGNKKCNKHSRCLLRKIVLIKKAL